MKIIAFGHRQRVGKDTAAKFLISAIRGMSPKINVKRIGLADRLKELCEESFRWAGIRDMAYYENNGKEKDRVLTTINKTPRQVWLEYGYHMNSICPTVFCELALEGQEADIVVVSDLRRPEEADFFRKWKGSRLIDITRPDTAKCESLYSGHPAYELDSRMDDYKGWDARINNDSTLRDFNYRIMMLAQKVV